MYGVGNGKSGTSTLTAMLGGYRARHECDRLTIRDMTARVLAGDLALDSPEVRRAFRWRSVRYNMEADVAGNLSIFVGPLATLYPDARFVLLMRDCFSWLDSRIEHVLSRPHDDRSPFHANRFARYDDAHDPVEAPLREAGLRPIASYLRSWAEISQGVLDAAPADRLLVIRTEDLDTSTPTLGRFLGIDPATIRVEHANHLSTRAGLLAAVPHAYVRERAEELCAPLMERFWGDEWTRLARQLPSAEL
jgi:hypothetical protein